MSTKDQFLFDASSFRIESPAYRDILHSVADAERHIVFEADMLVTVDSDNVIVSAEFLDGTDVIRKPDDRGGHVVMCCAPDGSLWYMTAPEVWMRMD